MKKLIKNSIILGGTRLGARTLGLISTFIIARILAPEDYAVMATCMIVQDLAYRLESVGFRENIISRQELDNKFIGSLLYLRLFFGVILFLFVFFSSDYAADFFNNPAVGPVLEVTSLIFLIQPLLNINVTIEIRNRNFIPNLKIQIFSKIISVISTITLALILENFWALAIGMVIGSISQTIISHLVLPTVWPKHFLKNEAKNIFGFSKWHLILQLTSFTGEKLNIFVVAKIFEQKIIGFFSLGSQIAQMYALEIVNAVDRANLSELANTKREAGDFKKKLLSSFSFNFTLKLLLLTPAYLVLILHTEFIINLLLGDQWLGMIEFFQLFALSAFIMGFSSTYEYGLIVYRVPKLSFYITLFALLIRGIFVYFAYIYRDPIILALSGVAIQLFRLLATSLILSSLSNTTIYSHLRLILRELIYMSIFTFIFILALNFPYHPLIQISLSILLSLLFVVTVFFIKPECQLGKVVHSSARYISNKIKINKNGI